MRLMKSEEKRKANENEEWRHPEGDEPKKSRERTMGDRR